MDRIREDEYRLIDALLKYDLETFANKLGLVDQQPSPIDDKVAVRLINLAERLSRRSTDIQEQNTCLLICALLWEHKQAHWHALSAALVNILTRLGLPPSAQMVDRDFDSETLRYSPLGSFIAECRTTLIIENYEVRVGDRHPIILSKFQKDMWDLLSGRFRRVGISAPTSAGKSFVLVAKIVDMAFRAPIDVFFIVPTITLINQVSKDIRLLSRKYGLSGLRVLQTYEPSKKERGLSSIYILTQERASAALKDGALKPNSLDVLIVDEVQNIERVSNEDDERSKDLYNLIHILENDVNPNLAVISGPRLRNIETVAGNLFNSQSVSLKAELPPVVNLTYAFRKAGKSVVLQQYYSEHSYPQRIELPSDRVSPDLFGKVRYDEKIYEYINKLLNALPDDSGTLVFSPTKNQAKNTAERINRMARNHHVSDSLASYLGESVHPNYSLINCVRKGVAYHHSSVPAHARSAVERAFVDKVIKVITCTTTLMQGVNLPAKNLIARNPFLSGSRTGPELTPYEFANLRGRAGRLLKDFVGRAIILDENTFDDAQIELFDYPEKDVDTGYGEKYREHRKNLIESLEKTELVTSDVAEYGFLMSHIRASVLRYGRNAKGRLLKSGIDIPDDLLTRVLEELAALSIPKEICLSFPHWDPLVLEKMYRSSKQKRVVLPTSPYSGDFISGLQDGLAFIQDTAPFYLDKYLGDVSNDKYVYKLLKAANSWGRESPLREVVSWKSEMTGEEVEDMLQLILTKVTHSLPKVLAPLVTMLNPKSTLLSFIESGIHSPLTRKLTEMGLAREVSIKVSRIIKPYLSSESVENLTEFELRGYASEVLPQLDYWERCQLEDVTI